MEEIKKIIPKVIANLSLSQPDTHARLKETWRKISQKHMNRHTSIVGIQKGRLLVNVDSPTWLFQVSLQKTRLLAQLKKAVPELTDIRFKIGKVK